MTKELILNTVADLVIDFVVYDRKDDEELPKGIIEKAIEKAIEKGGVTIDEIVEAFKKELIFILENEA